jgi:hypothetical protein
MSKANETKKELKDVLNNGAASGWIVVVIFFALFFPIGIYLAARQLSVAKVAAVGGSKSARYAAITLLVFSAIWLCIGIPEFKDDATVGAILTVFGLGSAYGGISTLITAKKHEALSGKYGRYLVTIVNQDCYGIEELSKALNVEYNTALQRVEEMVELGLFEGAYIDYKTKELVWGERPVAEVVSLNCPSCGGVNHNAVVGKKNKCEYCDSVIEA